MTTEEIIQSMQINLSNAYDKLAEKGATIPENKNLENLQSTIKTISGGAVGENKLNQTLTKTITELTAEDMQGVTVIPQELFYQCKSLTSAYLPDTLTSIGQRAFRESGLLSIEIPDSVKTISTQAFTLTHLHTIKLPNAPTTVGNTMFYGCSSLKSVTIPEGWTKVPNAMFDQCLNLAYISIPSTVTSIEAYSLFVRNCIIDIYADTPPTLQTNAISAIGGNTIRVNAGRAEVYKSATNWSLFADYIVERE